MPAQPTPSDSPVSAQPCRACTGPTRPFAKAQVLGHVDVTYHRCDDCGLVMAIDPTWLPEAYSDAIAALDIGLLDRCQILSNVTAMVLRAERLRGGTFLDWAGGYGTLTRMMRDRGYDFHHTDPMATNVFAGGHDVPDLAGRRYDLVTAFEVLEHLVDPAADLAEAAASTDRLLTTTHLVPDPAPGPEDWWYYTLESGQHITFYTRDVAGAARRAAGLRRRRDRLLRASLPPRPRLAGDAGLLRSPGAAYVTGLLSLPGRPPALPARRRRRRGQAAGGGAEAVTGRRGLWRSEGRSTKCQDA